MLTTLSATIVIQSVLRLSATRSPDFQSALVLVDTVYAGNTPGATPVWVTAPAGTFVVGHLGIGAVATIRASRDGRLNIFVQSVHTAAKTA